MELKIMMNSKLKKLAVKVINSINGDSVELSRPLWWDEYTRVATHLFDKPA